MDDKTLLELAAKAYWGDEIDDVCSVRWLDEDQAIGYTHGDNQDHNGQDREFVWNPRDDDADAFRLAVALHLKIEHYSYISEGYSHVCAGNSQPVMYGDDPAAAVRLAILRAAAAIGESK